MTTVPTEIKVLSSLQFISALISIPISFLTGMQHIAWFVLGGSFQDGTGFAANASLLTHGAIALLSLLTLAMGVAALYLSLSITPDNRRFALYGTMLTQSILCGAELAKFGFGVRGNLLTILLAIAILGYLYKPQWGSIVKSLRQGTFRFPRSLKLDWTTPSHAEVSAPNDSLESELAQQND